MLVSAKKSFKMTRDLVEKYMVNEDLVIYMFAKPLSQIEAYPLLDQQICVVGCKKESSCMHKSVAGFMEGGPGQWY